MLREKEGERERGGFVLAPRRGSKRKAWKLQSKFVDISPLLGDRLIYHGNLDAFEYECASRKGSNDFSTTVLSWYLDI